MRDREQTRGFRSVRADRAILPTMVGVVLAAAGCHLSDGPTQEPERPEPVAEAPGEGTGDAPRGIVTEPARNKDWPATTVRVGWYEPPATATTVIRAPATGFLLARSEAPWPVLGARVEQGLSPVQLGVFLTPQDIAQLVHLKKEADTQLQQSLVTMQVTEKQLRQVAAATDAVSGVRVDQIRESFEHARAAYNDAKEKLSFLGFETSESGVALSPVSIEVPRGGVVTEVSVALGQFVVAGDPLYTIADQGVLWLRVPVFEGDLGTIDLAREASATDRVTGETFIASPLRLPTLVKPGRRTVDLWYAIENSAGKLQPGRTASIALPVDEPAREGVVIPRSAVLYDGFGQASCFVQRDADDSTGFERRRIELGPTHEEAVAVTRGLVAGEEVVVVGAEQLAGEAAGDSLVAEDDD